MGELLQAKLGKAGAGEFYPHLLEQEFPGPFAALEKSAMGQKDGKADNILACARSVFKALKVFRKKSPVSIGELERLIEALEAFENSRMAKETEQRRKHQQQQAARISKAQGGQEKLARELAQMKRAAALKSSGGPESRRRQIEREKQEALERERAWEEQLERELREQEEQERLLELRRVEEHEEMEAKAWRQRQEGQRRKAGRRSGALQALAEKAAAQSEAGYMAYQPKAAFGPEAGIADEAGAPAEQRHPMPQEPAKYSAKALLSGLMLGRILGNRSKPRPAPGAGEAEQSGEENPCEPQAGREALGGCGQGGAQSGEPQGEEELKQLQQELQDEELQEEELPEEEFAEEGLPEPKGGQEEVPAGKPTAAQFHAAVKRGDVAALEAWSAQEPGLCSSVHKGLSAMCLAAAEGRLEAMALLGAMGADFGQPDKKGILPISWACMGAQLEALEFLASLGQDPNGTDGNGRTPLHYAALSGVSESVRRLVERHKCDETARDSTGRTPIDLAWEGGRRGIARYLESLPAERRRGKA